MSKDLQKTEEQQIIVQNAPVTAEMLMSQAIEKGTDVAVMEKLFNLQREWKKDRAKEMFDEAMANFQGDCPAIKKTKDVIVAGKIVYSYAPIDVIVEHVRGLLKQNGLSYTIKTEVSSDKVKSICVVKHLAGHSEESEMEVPFGTKTNVMSSSQVVAAASTFSKRYAFLNAFGIMTGDDDNEQVLNQQPQEDTSFIEEIAKINTLQKLKEYHNENKKKYKSIAYNNAILERKKYLEIPVVKQ